MNNLLQNSTYILKAFVLGLGIIGLALCIFVLPQGLKTNVEFGYRPIIVGMYIAAVPLFIALYETMRFLYYVDTNSGFTALAQRSLIKIKNCALVISIIYALGMPYIYLVADKDDAPGVIVVGLVIIGASLAVANFAAVLGKLLRHN